MMTEREYYDSLSNELKADIRLVIADKNKCMEVAKKHNLTYRERGREYAKGTFLNMITVVKKFENPPEEIAESNRRVAEIGRELKRTEFEDYKIDFRRLRDDLQAVARLLEEGGLIDHLDRYDYQRVKALAAAYELWDFVANLIVCDDELWEKACADIRDELGVGDE